MWISLLNRVGYLYRWLINRPSYVLLTADDEAFAGHRAHRFAKAWAGLILLSILCGAMLNIVWSQAYMLFGEMTGLRIMPAVTAMAVAVLWPYKRSLAALASFFGQAAPAAIAAGAAIMVLVMGLISVKSWHSDVFVMPAAIAWMRPNLEEGRALALMPLWGAWAMLITCQFCRPCEASEPAIRAFAKGCDAVRAVLALAVPALGTWAYFGFLDWDSFRGWGHLKLSAITTVAAILVGLLLCRLCGGLSRRCLLATNLATQIIFLLACVHCARI